MAKKIMISQPMAGFTVEQIEETRNRFLEFAEKENLEVVNIYFADEWSFKESMEERGVIQIPLCFLAKAIEKMSLCDKVYFAKGWYNHRGCWIEHEIAVRYGLEVIYEEPQVQTFGQKAVGLSFNPSDNGQVSSAKQKFADAIDQMNNLRNSSASSEQKRLYSIAITEAQGAQMWSVKALTWRD